MKTAYKEYIRDENYLLMTDIHTSTEEIMRYVNKLSPNFLINIPLQRHTSWYQQHSRSFF